MQIDKNKYPQLLEASRRIEGNMQSINDFITTFISLTGIRDIRIDEKDDCFILDKVMRFCDIDDFEKYFTIHRKIDRVYYGSLRDIMDNVTSREVFVREARKLTGNEGIMHLGSVVRLDDTDFYTKASLYEYLTPKSYFDSIIKDVSYYDISEDGTCVWLDGIALLFSSKETYLGVRREKCDIEGYLEGKEIVWDLVSKNAFKPFETDRGVIYLLHTLKDNNVTTVYRSIRPTDLHVTKRPYPVAILNDNTYAHYFKD